MRQQMFGRCLQIEPLLSSFSSPVRHGVVTG